MNTNTLQTALEKKAEERLAKDLRDFRMLIVNHPLFSNRGGENINVQIPKLKTTTPPEMSWVNTNLTSLLVYDDYVYKQLKEYWLPIYIREETERFLANVEHTKVALDELYNSTQLENPLS